MTSEDNEQMGAGEILGETEVQAALNDPSNTVTYKHYVAAEAPKVDGQHKLKMPTLDQLLKAQFKERKYLLAPWLREHENCMVYAATGIGKSLFAMSAALAVAGGGDFLGWRPEAKADGDGWRVLYVDGEMHIADIQERARQLRNGINLDKKAADGNLSFLARQHQNGGVQFPSITERAGQDFVLAQLNANKVDLVIRDNFSTLGEVDDENSASSFNAIQQFLLQLKVQQVATMLVHHTGKAGDNFRGSSKLAATFETIIQLETPQVVMKRTSSGGWEKRPAQVEHGEAKFRVRWDKVRAGSKTPPRAVVAHLVTNPPGEVGGEPTGTWEYETASLERLDEIAERLPAGEFMTQKEIAEFFGVTPTMARKYLDQGIKLGLWSEETISRGLALGKRLRTRGKTEAPVRPDASWKSEELVDGDAPANNEGSLTF
jgi:AAA domain